MQFSSACRQVTMFSLNANDIYDVVKPLHNCSQILGLTSFTIKRKHGLFVASINIYSIICNVSSSALCLYFGAWYIKNKDEFQVMEGSDVFENSIVCVSFGYLSFCLLQNWWFIFVRKYFADILNMLTEIDNDLQVMKVPVNHRHHKAVVLLFICIVKLIASVIIVAALVAIGHSANTSGTQETIVTNLFISVAVMVTTELNVYVMQHFTFWMWTVKVRYEKVNLFLQRSFLTSVNTSTKDGLDNMNKAARLHDKLVDVSKLINICYGLPVKYENLNFEHK